LREAVTRPSSRVSPIELISDPTALERIQSASSYLRHWAAAEWERQRAPQTDERTVER
jgi:hypothetical protein